MKRSFDISAFCGYCKIKYAIENVLNIKVFFNNITLSKNPTIFKKNKNSVMETKKAMYDNRGNEK